MQNTKKIPGWGIALIVIAVIIGIVGMMFVGPYNTMVKMDEKVSTTQAGIQTALQSRLDKINELMPSVQGIMDHESEVFTEITALRSGKDGIKVDKDGNMTIDSSASAEDLQKADAASSQIIRDINVTVEAYPQLQANQAMSDFMTSIEGIENRLSVARDNYNEAVQEYNTYVRSFPKNLIAGMFGFSPKDKFEASSAAQDAPVVNFD